MDFFNSRDKINFIFILSLVSIILYVTPGWGLEPTITDVTTRSFSVVWTESISINPDSHNCSLTVKKGGEPIESNQIIKPELDAEGLPNEEGRLGLGRGVVKFEVIELDPDSAYTVNGKKSNGSTSLFTNDQTVVTEKFKGLSSYADANDNDIVTNDIFHWAVYDIPLIPGDTPKTPALGAMVMAEIYEDADCTTIRLSDYPITGWVGAGMPGKLDSPKYFNEEFDPNNVSYKEFAALNFNNLFDPNHYPLQLNGDVAVTPEVEGEYIKLTVIRGVENGSPKAETIHKLPVPEISKAGDQKISSAKVGSKIVFQAKMNLFTYPYEVPEGYTVRKLVEAIQSAGGQVLSVKIHMGGASWKVASVNPFGAVGPDAAANIQIEPGKGYLIIMKDTLPPNFYICNSPTPSSITLRAKLNIASFTQIPSFYTVRDLVNSIRAVGGNVLSIKIHTGGASWKVASVNPFGAVGPDAAANRLIERGKSYLIIMKDTQTEITVDPLIN